ncbi:beta-ketoacyl synthase N-terminal-like domain-containing protein [Hymenobacter sp. ASUV-10]|uniref:Beta-ketoacyl synthase N-terminal-like domain-containing protein n=1 Tax=Hymenobacter aranciens TaxID=3063996 RepID=A0ABT9BC19_9BACT|nr:beta-ketoacyl synthase N-terminal-like domain-containing protein [Hymenobacter sp. ASUV-10]MDO7875804.1 beta-ketoacyl synthase N-terminal-like domain-containing protein [Hymenobacter sp. ASUV-10]
MVLLAAQNIISPLGLTVEANFAALLANQSAVVEYPQQQLDGSSLWAARLADDWPTALPFALAGSAQLTRFEQVAVASIQAAQAQTAIDLSSPRTVFILATTKGSIDLLAQEPEPSVELLARASLPTSARLIAQTFGNINAPLVVSNACISGLNAIVLAQRLLLAGQYEHAVVVGADLVSEFVYSGFYSFQALCVGRCRPFSADRNGLNLGEAAATVILTTDAAAVASTAPIRVAGGAITNDANHLSGPSRTGQELELAIRRALAAAGTIAENVNVISAHGTATVYNDEMEGKAFALAGLANTPIGSVKGALGHTLGAAGVLEAVLLAQSLQTSTLLPTVGYSEPMPEVRNPVLTTPQTKPLRYGLKTASGFGGCNGALVFERLH